MRPPWRPQRRNQRPKRKEISYLREWRRGESNRPAEDSGGRRSKLYRDLSWGCLPPTTLHYRQLVPRDSQERQLRSLTTVLTQPISHHPNPVRNAMGGRSPRCELGSNGLRVGTVGAQSSVCSHAIGPRGRRIRAIAPRPTRLRPALVARTRTASYL